MTVCRLKHREPVIHIRPAKWAARYFRPHHVPVKEIQCAAEVLQAIIGPPNPPVNEKKRYRRYFKVRRSGARPQGGSLKSPGSHASGGGDVDGTAGASPPVGPTFPQLPSHFGNS